MNKRASGGVWFFVILAGLAIGGLLGELLSVYPNFSWLNYGKEFGFNTNSPMILNFYVIELTFGLAFKITVGSIIGVLLSMTLFKIYRR